MVARQIFAACQPDFEFISIGIKINFVVSGEETHGISTTSIWTGVCQRAVDDAGIMQRTFATFKFKIYGFTIIDAFGIDARIEGVHACVQRQVFGEAVHVRAGDDAHTSIAFETAVNRQPDRDDFIEAVKVRFPKRRVFVPGCGASLERIFADEVAGEESDI